MTTKFSYICSEELEKRDEKAVQATHESIFINWTLIIGSKDKMERMPISGILRITLASCGAGISLCLLSMIEKALVTYFQLSKIM